MNKKLIITILSIGLSAIVGFAGFGIWHSSQSAPKFEQAGYVLQGEDDGVKWHSFESGEKYSSTLAGTINFKSDEEGTVSVSQESFAHFDDNSMMALSDGVLLDFNDLSDNYINNYYINAGLRISETGDAYTAQTTAGTMQFGEHLWKLSDQKYLIASPNLRVHMSKDDVRETQEYVQVVITEDNVVNLLTKDNLWMTISDDCYVETQDGVKIYPTTQIIDDGANKLSMAKLSVSPDDSIVLTEDETRRQIVPELNIEAIDGADGQDGEDGRVGNDGENGENGEDGEQGPTGVTGNTGATGASGSAGATGPSGGSGAKGKDGKNAIIESTTNSALPTMTINDWQVSATELKGSISVKDPGDFLSAIADEAHYQTKYPGSVVITNVETGQIIVCHQENETYTIASSTGTTDTVFTDFYTGTGTVVYFATPKDALQPDTEYKISVTAYYKATDDTGLIYSREFISRFFYTDSTGVILAKESAETDAVTVSASISESYRESILRATVYLLTPEQNMNFSTASVSDTSAYTGKTEISSDDFKNENWNANAQFTGLEHNKDYVARVIVETKTGLTTLTTQELAVKTLKQMPAKKTEGDLPKVYYNRVNGAFEVYRPAVNDPDGGATNYTYTAYKLKSDNTWEKVTARTITPSTGEPVEFHLQSGEIYKFGVELEFNDNEKLVYYDLGESKSIAAAGETMPKLVIEPSAGGTDYNKYVGTIKIDLAGNSSITVGEGYPLKLEFFADQIWDQSVELTNGDPVSLGSRRGTVTYDMTVPNTNRKEIKLQLDNLYKNTNYTVTVSGYLNVGDGNGAVNRAIGTVSFHTYDTLNIAATWTRETTNHTFARKLSIAVQDSASTTLRENYVMENLKEGQVTLELFSGTGIGKLKIAQKKINDKPDLASLFSPAGLLITEDTFGGPPLNSEGNYTLMVTTVADESYGINLGYVNTFDKIQNASEVVAAEATPPDLLTDPSKGVNAKPIYNKDAVKFGTVVDEELPDDAIIGYTLEATYDNVQRIGKEITYYAYEYNTFFNALRNSKDPIKVATPLMRMTQPIDSSKDTVPKIALLFGGNEATADAASRMYNGYQIYYAGNPNLTGESLVSGMDRGYRYIFAYTVQYAGGTSGESEAVRTYPYDHKAYRDYNLYYGGLKENNVKIGVNVAYVLNSGMCEAPKIMPDFHTYVYSSTQNDLAGQNATAANGKIELHYRWRDPDHMVITNVTDDKNTKISYPIPNATGSSSQNINKLRVDGEWYKVEIPYVISKSDGGLLAPTVNISEYVLDYSYVLEQFALPKDVKDYPIANIPLEWSWEKQFGQNAYNNAVLVSLNAKLEENHIDFYIQGSTDDAAKDALINRAVAMKLEIKTTDEAQTTKEFTLPLTTDVSGTFARLTTGLLGTEFLNKEFKASATLYYDTGLQGWDILEKEAKRTKGFALQYTNDSTDKEMFGFSSYIGASNNNLVPANGALLGLAGSSANFDPSQLRELIKEKAENDSKYSLHTYNILSGTGTIRYLYPTRMGVDVHNGSNVSNLSGQYAVPKQIAEYDLQFVNGDNKVTLNTITPTITKPFFEISGTAVTPTSYTVAGFANGGTIYMAAYSTRKDAEELNTQHDSNITIPVNAEGRPERSKMTGLTAGKKYYIAFYYRNAEGKNIMLLRSDTAEAAIFEVTTSANAVIDVTKLEYLNTGYFDKLLTVDFSISRIYNVKVEYDIYPTETDAEKQTNPVLMDAQMNTEDENAILMAPNIVSGTDNHLQLNLRPAPTRSKLVPGVTYYLRISAYEPSASPGGTKTPVGYKIQPFTITSVGNLGALIYVQQATDNSIKFRVIINDPQYTLMGRPNNGKEGALYAVRFTDEDGYVLRTIYDDEVYSASKDLYQDFELCDSNLKDDGITRNNSINANTQYNINIYAVPDWQHNGQIVLGEETKTWKDFFDSTIAEFKNCGAKLINIIKEFWKDNTANNSDNDAIEQKLLIAKKLQSTTTDSGWLLNIDGIYASRYNSETVRIMLEESFGLIQDDGSVSEPVFKRIDWQVDGYKSDGTPLSLSGSELRSAGATLLEENEIAGKYSSYYFDIPQEVVEGSYKIILKFYKSEEDVASEKSVTIRSGV